MAKDNDVKKNIELAITGIGIIILIYTGINSASKAKHAQTPVAAASYAASELSLNMFSKSLPEDNIPWGRDPFLSDGSIVREQGMEDLTLNGIVPDKASPYAVINNEVFKIGDKIGEMTIVEINETTVVLDENGKLRTLELTAD